MVVCESKYMKNNKVHIRCLSSTLCGIKDHVFISFAKKWKDVTCKRCMRTWEYKQYLKGRYKEKP